MRRGFSIFLILVFGFGSLSAAIPGSEDANLPACCRRHGVHRCAMTATTVAGESGSTSGSAPVVSAPLTCPNFPGLSAMFATPAAALAASATSTPAAKSQAFLAAAIGSAASSGPGSAYAGRGPPKAA